METHEVLKKVKTGEISVEDAELFFRRQPSEEMGYASAGYTATQINRLGVNNE